MPSHAAGGSDRISTKWKHWCVCYASAAPWGDSGGEGGGGGKKHWSLQDWSSPRIRETQYSHVRLAFGCRHPIPASGAASLPSRSATSARLTTSRWAWAKRGRWREVEHQAPAGMGGFRRQASWPACSAAALRWRLSDAVTVAAASHPPSEACAARLAAAGSGQPRPKRPGHALLCLVPRRCLQTTQQLGTSVPERATQ